MIRLGVLLTLFWGATPALAQSEACTVLAAAAGKGAIHLPQGRVENGSLVLRGRRIAQAGAGLQGIDIQGDAENRVALWNGLTCRFVDISNAEVTAGLVAVETQLGVVEIGLEESTRDENAGGTDPVRASFQVAEGYNPRSTLIPIQRVMGVTSATVMPSGGLVSGLGAWVDLAGATQADAVVDRQIAMVATANWMRLRELLDDTRQFSRNRSAYDQNRIRDLSASRLDLAAMVPVIQGETPLVLSVNRASDIEAAIAFQKEQDIQLVLSGGAEAWMWADALAEAQIPVIIDPLVSRPRSFDQMHGRDDNGALLALAGVQVMLSTYETHNARTLRQVAGNAVRAGMDASAALKAITSTPATVFGQSDRGRLEAGAIANLVIWTGDPLELSTSVVALIIGGDDVTLKTRQTELLDRYRTLPGTPLVPMELP